MASEPVQTQSSWLPWVIGLLLLAGLLFLLIELFADDEDEVQDLNVDLGETNGIVTDNVGDNDTIVDITPDNNTLDADIDTTVTAFNNVSVTEVISDRLFRGTANGQAVLMYLDGSLDLGAAETRIDIDTGDRVSVNGRYTNDLSGQRLESDESNAVNIDRTVFLVTSLNEL